MKTPQCEIDGHDIQLEMTSTEVPYLGIKCICKTCGAEWLENYERIFVSDAVRKVSATSPTQIELITL